MLLESHLAPFDAKFGEGGIVSLVPDCEVD